MLGEAETNLASSQLGQNFVDCCHGSGRVGCLLFPESEYLHDHEAFFELVLHVVAFRAAKSIGIVWRVLRIRDSSGASQVEAGQGDVKVHVLKLYDFGNSKTNAGLTIHAANVVREFNLVVQVWSVHHGKDSVGVEREVAECLNELTSMGVGVSLLDHVKLSFLINLLQTRLANGFWVGGLR